MGLLDIFKKKEAPKPRPRPVYRPGLPAHPDPQAFLLRAGKALARELAGDLPRLNAVLKKVTP